MCVLAGSNSCHNRVAYFGRSNRTLLPDAVMVAATVTLCPPFAAERMLIVLAPTTSMVTLSSIEWYTGV